MSELEIFALIFAGLSAGFINTLAGNGSLITLTLLMEFFGLPPLVANGTNRVGIVFHSMVTSYSMSKHHALPKIAKRHMLPIIFVGGIVGGLLSIYVSNEQFRLVYRILLVVLFFTLIINPKRWLKPELFTLNFPQWAQVLILFIVGLYGGFIQMGMGIFLLAVLVLIYKLPMMTANTIKLFSVLIYTPFVLVILIMNDLVDWKYGLIIAIGQLVGGWVTSRYIAQWRHANILAYILLVIMVSVALVKIIFF